MSDFIEVRTALPSQVDANKIAQYLVTERLAASAQVTGPIASTYWWKDEITNAEEWLVTAKTRQALYNEIEQAIRRLHSYEEPGIIAVPMAAGSTSYFAWIAKETSMETQQTISADKGQTKEQIIQAFDEAYERLIAAATRAAEQGSATQNSEWGPREILAHIAGWAAQATAILPQIIAGLPPQTYVSDHQHNAIDEAFNVAYITLIGDQSFEQVLAITHQSHQRFVQILKAQDESIFVPGNYVYERMKRVIDHHLEHVRLLTV
ncbi:MAG TPA: divalent cation tolerance protein CutA [Ktedonobacteraceae bacterium]|nr:divalent cation tolerance protein CutA [Ktedonobacteraceae bacterium]